MEKERFLDLAKNYTSLTEAEANDLDALQKQYPYSQVIHNLASRGAQDNGFSSSKKLLNVSAVYSTDRSVLKDIITTPRTERTAEQKKANVEQQKVEVVEETTTTITQVVVEETIVVDHSLTVDQSVIDEIENLHGEALNNEIMSDLEKLKELKHNFELTVEEFQHSTENSKQNQKPTTPKNSAVKKKEHPIEVTPEPSGEILLEEIKNTKKKIIPESQKQKEQIEIIDQFIKKQPSITKNAGNASDASDLAEKNFSLTDNIVSETLVEILLRQGKKDKAIEVLKKLIWKFPQKKAYFAAQIEDLSLIHI